MATAFYKVECGQETTAGTAVPSTTTLPSFAFRPAMGYLEVVQPEEERGSLAAYHRNYVASELVEGTLEGEATFEEITIPLCMAIEDANGAATSTEAGSSYRWSFEPNWTSGNSPGTWTLEYGDDTQAWETEYVFGSGLTISGSVEEAWTLSCDVAGRANTSTTFTGSPVTSGYTIETILMQKSKLYMADDTSSDLTTSDQVSGAFLDFEWSLPDHYAPRFTGDGNLYFSGVRESKVAPELTVSLVVDSNTKSQITQKYENQTRQIVWIEGIGSTISGSYDKYVKIKGAYAITDLSELSDEDGDTTITLTMTGEYSSKWGSLFSVELFNELDYPYGESS